VTIRVAVSDGPARRVLEQFGSDWARNRGATLVVTSERPDILAFRPADLGKLVAEGALAPLPESLTAVGSFTGLARPYRSNLLRWGDTAFALPVIGDATLLIARSSAGPLPDNFPALLDRAKKLSDEGKSPCLPPIDDDDALDREFFTLAAGFVVDPYSPSTGAKKAEAGADIVPRFAFHFDTLTGEPLIAGPGFVAALQWLIDAQPYRGKSGFGKDGAVLGLATLKDLAALREAGRVAEFTVGPPPAGKTGELVPYLGPAGIVAGVTKSAQRPEAMVALLRHLCDSEASLEVVHSPSYGSAPYRPSQLGDRRDGWFNYGFDAAGTERLRSALGLVMEPRAVNAPVRLRVREQEKYRRVLLDAIRKAIATKADAKATLEAVATEWRKIDSRPADERLTEYLRSLNLRQ
jgi:hypothetical protein